MSVTANLSSQLILGFVCLCMSEDPQSILQNYLRTIFAKMLGHRLTCDETVLHNFKQYSEFYKKNEWDKVMAPRDGVWAAATFHTEILLDLRLKGYGDGGQSATVTFSSPLKNEQL